MGACEGAFPPRILQKQRRPLAFQTMNCTPADYRLQKSMGQTTDRNRATLPSLFGMKFTQVPSQYSKQIGEVKATIEVWVHAKAPSTYPETVPSCHVSCESSTGPLALQTMNCTPADYRLQKSVGQTTNRNRARLHSLFGMKFTQVPSQYSKQIKEVQVTIKVWVRVKAPSRHVSCKSSAALWLFKQ